MLRVLAVVALAALAGCDRRPDDAELDRLLAEARARDAAELAAHGGADERSGWTLTVMGQVQTPSVLDWRALEATRKDSIRTHAPESYTRDALTFEGVRLSTLLERAGADASATELTVVAFDGFRATIRADDARRFPVLFAMSQDGAPIPRNRGGPLYLVYPFDTAPELTVRYTGSFWVYYATHLVVGTEPVALRVGERTFDRAALDALPAQSLTGPVGFRGGWPSGAVRVSGVRLGDVLAAAQTSVPEGCFVRVRTMVPLHEELASGYRVPAATVRDHDVLLVLRQGDDEQPVTARLGGPLLVAYPPESVPEGSSEWPTFVRALEVECSRTRLGGAR